MRRRTVLLGLASATSLGGCLQLEQRSGEDATPAGTPTERAGGETTNDGRGGSNTSDGATDEATPTDDGPLEPQAPGNLRWEFETLAPADRVAPLVVDGTVYAASTDTRIYAIDAERGTERWNRELGEPRGLSVSGDQLLVGSFEQTAALSLDDGSVTWRNDVGTRSPPQPANGDVISGGVTPAGEIRAIDRDSGDTRWRFRPDGRVIGHLAVTDGTVCVPAGGHDGTDSSPVYGLDLETGDPLWEDRVEAEPASAVAVDGGFVVVSKQGQLLRFDSDGDRRWSRTIDGVRGAAGAPLPLVGNDRLYLGDRTARALSLATGETEWTFTGGRFLSRPVSLDGSLYTKSGDESVIYRLDPASGENLGTVDTGLEDVDTTALAVGPETFVVGAGDGSVYAIWR